MTFMMLFGLAVLAYIAIALVIFCVCVWFDVNEDSSGDGPGTYAMMWPMFTVVFVGIIIPALIGKGLKKVILGVKQKRIEKYEKRKQERQNFYLPTSTSSQSPPPPQPVQTPDLPASYRVPSGCASKKMCPTCGGSGDGVKNTVKATTALGL